MKLRCPQCSTVVEAVTDPIRCPSCGFTAPLPPGRTSTPAAAPPPAPSYAQPSLQPPAPSYAAYNQPAPSYGAQPYGSVPSPATAYAGVRPVGKQRTPFLIILFSILTIGIYTFVWEWKISKEMDAFTGTNRHKIMRRGVVFAIIGVLLLVIGFGALYASIGALPTDESTAADTAALGGIMGFVLLMIVAAGLLLTAYIMIIMGFWRVWTALEHDDKMRAQPSPTNSTLLLVLFILGILIPYVGVIMVFVVYYMSQSSLNRTWQVYGGSGMPMQPAYPTA